MANTKVREYPAIVKESVCGPEIVIGVNATSITEAHDMSLAYCKAHSMFLDSVCMPQR
jgi:hypothetical protein